MPLNLLGEQKRAQEIGRIRCGLSEDTGRTNRHGRPIRRPVKSATFILSSSNQTVIRAAAEKFGGEVEAWEDQWRVITTVAEIPVSIPGGPTALSQDWELWSGGVCVRRCDNITEKLRQAPCLCPADQLDRAALAADGKACKPKSRINVIIPDLPGLGVWRLETGSWYAAIEIGGTIELLSRAREIGVLIPAQIRLEHQTPRKVQHRGTEREKVVTLDFYVVKIDVLPTMRELAELGSGQPLAAQLPPAPDVMKAITAGRVPTPTYGVKAPASWGVDTSTPGSDEAAQEEPRSAQSIADEARTAKLDGLRDLWSEANRLGWLDELVCPDPDAPDVFEDLRGVINGYAALIEETSRKE
jgi:Recombination directionality factor-like